MVPVTLQFPFGVQRHKPYGEREARVSWAGTLFVSNCFFANICFSNKLFSFAFIKIMKF